MSQSKVRGILDMPMLSTCYIAGPMRGYDQYNFPMFDQCRNSMRARTFKVVSPADMDRCVGFDPTQSDAEPELTPEFLRAAQIRDVMAIINKADFVVMLPGWKFSTGALGEFQLARWKGIPVFEWHPEDDTLTLSEFTLQDVIVPDDSDPMDIDHVLSPFPVRFEHPKHPPLPAGYRLVRDDELIPLIGYLLPLEAVPVERRWLRYVELDHRHIGLLTSEQDKYLYAVDERMKEVTQNECDYFFKDPDALPEETQPEIDVVFPTSKSTRKAIPIWSGVMKYFPKTIQFLAFLSWAGNEQHNKGQPLHWARGKSMDHMDCFMRHAFNRLEMDYGDPDAGDIPMPHCVKASWRSLADSELILERHGDAWMEEIVDFLESQE